MQKSLILIVAVLLIVACGSPKAKKVAVLKPQESVLKEHPGEVAYKKNCVSCHQKDAGGVPGMYPPLADNKVVSGDKNHLIDIMLNGLSGEIEVNGEIYNGVMANYRNLSDKDIADILNYIRANFGNEGAEVTVSEIKALR